MAKKFSPVNLHVSFPEQENKTIDYWKEEKIFERSVSERPEDKQWNFLDGPPFITGLPHYGSLLSSIPKDVFPRYWTMKGYRVRRVWGWDCHGLPAENKVENKLGIVRKKDIEEKVGVKKFIDECKAYVGQVSSEWEWYIDHVARWVDFENAYKTMDFPYMESVMWVFKSMYDKGYVYKGMRVSLYCPHCETPISNFEVAMDPDNYKEVTEPANTYKYKAVGEDNTYYLAWSTTPWNKLATPALAVNPSHQYVKVKQDNEFYILAKGTLKTLKDTPYEVVEEVKGSDLVGRMFEPHYDYYTIDEGKRAFVIIPGEFVTEDEGTGIVTIAAYGEDDLAAMKKENIQIVLHVNEEGKLIDAVPQWGGMNYLEVNPLVNEDLTARGLMYDEKPHTHTIPTCWRCHTRLFYAPQDAWYVDIQKLKPAMEKTNEDVAWFPEHFKHGRFLKSMQSAPDWCISRSRYWGSPVPVWDCTCGERIVVGSVEELTKLSGKEVSDLHKPEIDEITIPCPKCGKEVHRVPEVLDSWIEAGSASFAERHYPFDTSQRLEDFFPPDFIVEYTGQIRAWFYVLHVIATAIYETKAFKNVVVTGVVLGTDGRKMSKNFGNYPDPKEMIQKYGGDALRLYMLGTPVMRGEDIRISEEEYRNQIKELLLPLWNVYNFFVTYSLIDAWEPSEQIAVSDQVLDRWILSRMHTSIKRLTQAYETYDTPSIVSEMKDFVVKDLSGWFIRRSRDRVGPSASVEEKQMAYQTLYTVLTTYTKAMAPMIPFVTEEIYRNLVDEDSVHLAAWPQVDETLIDQSLEAEMQAAREVVEIAHSIRKEKSIKLRQPLASATVFHPVELTKTLDVMKDEINVLNIMSVKGEAHVDFMLEITPELKEVGDARELIRSIQEARKNLGTKLTDMVDVVAPDWPESQVTYIKKKALVHMLTKGEFAVTLHS